MILAQTNPTGLTPEFFGMLVLGLIFVSRWLWDYRKNTREEDDRKEPKSNPPLHERFISRPEYTRDQEEIDGRLNAATRSRKDMHKDIEDHAARLAALEKTEEHTNAALSTLNTKMDQVLLRLPRSQS